MHLAVLIRVGMGGAALVKRPSPGLAQPASDAEGAVCGEEMLSTAADGWVLPDVTRARY